MSGPDPFAQPSANERVHSEAAKAAADAKLQEVLAQKGNLDTWYAQTVQEVEKIKRESARTPAADPPAFDASKFLTKEEAQKLTIDARTQIEAQSLALQEAIDDVKSTHFKTFGELLSTRELVDKVRRLLGAGA